MDVKSGSCIGLLISEAMIAASRWLRGACKVCKREDYAPADFVSAFLELLAKLLDLNWCPRASLLARFTFSVRY